MGLFDKIKNLIGNNSEFEGDETPREVANPFSPETLDKAPYSFVDALYAVRQGNLAKIQDYLKFNKNYVYCRSWDDCTLLHEACRFSRKEIVDILLKNGASVEGYYKGNAPLHLAIEGDSRENNLTKPEEMLDYKKRRREVVKLLLEAKADCETPNEAGDLPLHIAAKFGYNDLVEILLERGAKVDSLTLSTDPKTPSVARTPLLMSARYRKDKKTFQVLLEHGADPNLRDKDPGFAPLHYVATYRYPADTAPQETRELALVELANLLATHKADLNLLSDNKRQQSALHLAILNHHVKLVDFLLNQGADIHSQDAKNTMPLGMAAESGNIEMMEYLMSKGADIMKSRALFHAAACGKSIEPLKLLISKGADINMPDSAGYTPLFPAISAYSLDNVKLLLDSGADKNMYSPKGLTVREHAFASWGEVESVSDTKMAEERRRNADNARDIIMLLGGFDR